MANDNLDKLLTRLKNLNSAKTTGPEADSLEKIAIDLSTIYRGTMVRIDDAEKQFQIFKQVKEQAKTAGEFYALYLITLRDPHMNGLGFLQQAAEKGHVLALRDVTIRALAGHFNPVKDSIKWGLNCLRYLEQTVIPTLEKKAPHSKTLSSLKERLAELRERRAEILPDVIPKEPKDFNKLVSNYEEYRKKRGGETLGDFKLSQSQIQKLEKNPPLSTIISSAVSESSGKPEAHQVEKIPPLTPTIENGPQDRKIATLDRLLSRLDNLPSAKGSDSLEKIAMDLSTIYQGTMVRVDVLDKQFQIVNKIRDQAQTGGEFYALYLITLRDPHMQGLNYLQQAAEQGHVLALRDVTSKAFAGHFTPLEDSIKWGLNCLRYLEETVVPKLEQEEPHSETLNTLKEGLARLRERRAEILPDAIPQDRHSFSKLVSQFVEYRKNRGGETLGDFKLPQNQFQKLEESKLTPELAREKAALLQLLVPLTKKVDELHDNQEQNVTVLKIAKNLNSKLVTAIHTYINNKANALMSEEKAATLFIDTCTAAINNDKPLLEKELGWGDFLTNLLKSLANAVITAVNALGRVFGAESQITLFKPAQAPLISEVEQIEHDLEKQRSTPKK